MSAAAAARTVVLIVANPSTSDAVLAEHSSTLERVGAEVAVIDLRAFAPAPRPGSPLPVRAVRALVAGWWASRGLRGSRRDDVRRAWIVVAGDRMAVPTIWRERRHARGLLVNGVPAAVAEIRASARS